LWQLTQVDRSDHPGRGSISRNGKVRFQIDLDGVIDAWQLATAGTVWIVHSQEVVHTEGIGPGEWVRHTDDWLTAMDLAGTRLNSVCFKGGPKSASKPAPIRIRRVFECPTAKEMIVWTRGGDNPLSNDDVLSRYSAATGASLGQIPLGAIYPRREGGLITGERFRLAACSTIQARPLLLVTWYSNISKGNQNGWGLIYDVISLEGEIVFSLRLPHCLSGLGFDHPYRDYPIWVDQLGKSMSAEAAQDGVFRLHAPPSEATLDFAVTWGALPPHWLVSQK
jgi:hypothetical protein